MTGAPSSLSISPIRPSLLLSMGSASSQWHDDFTSLLVVRQPLPHRREPPPSPPLPSRGRAHRSPHTQQLSSPRLLRWRRKDPPWSSIHISAPIHGRSGVFHLNRSNPPESLGFYPWLAATIPSLSQELHRLRARCLARRPRLLDSHGGMTKLEVPGTHPWLEVEDKADVWGPHVSE